MKAASIAVLAVRVVAVLLGPVLILQGVSTAGFVAIVGLFSTTLGHFLHVLALVGLGLGIVVLGGWLVYGGLLNFPLVRARVGRSIGSE